MKKIISIFIILFLASCTTVGRFGAGVDIGSLCSALGAKTYEVSDPGDLEKTLKSAISTVNKGRTAVVEVKTKRVNASLHSLWQD